MIDIIYYLIGKGELIDLIMVVFFKVVDWGVYICVFLDGIVNGLWGNWRGVFYVLVLYFNIEVKYYEFF